MSGMSDSQRQRAEQNRLKALQIRQQKLAASRCAGIPHTNPEPSHSSTGVNKAATQPPHFIPPPLVSSASLPHTNPEPSHSSTGVNKAATQPPHFTPPPSVSSASVSSTVTGMNDSQRQRAEQNRLKALQIRQQKLAASGGTGIPHTTSEPSHSSTGTYKATTQPPHFTPPPPLSASLSSTSHSQDPVQAAGGSGVFFPPAKCQKVEPSSSVPPDIKKRIEENRRRAMERREELRKSREEGVAVVSSPAIEPAHPAPSSSITKPAAPRPLLRTITVTFMLNSPKTFIANMSKLQTSLIQVFKTMTSRSYDPKTHKWSFLLTEHNKLVAALRPFNTEVEVKPLPRFVLEAMEQAGKKLPAECIDLFGLDARLHDALMPFQVEGVKFGISLGGRVLIADEMGLGKTIQALGIACHYRSEWPLLIVTPSSTRYSWEESILRWVSSVTAADVVVMNTGNDSIEGATVIITSYDLLSRKASDMLTHKFGVVVLDESHMIKSYKSARYKAACPIVKKTKRVILLSGTPALSRPVELYTQISSVNPSLFPQFQDYGLRYCEGRKDSWGWTYRGSSNTEELQVILQSCVWIRRLKSEVLSQLPPKQRMTVVLDPSLISNGAANFDEMFRKFKGHSLGSLQDNDHLQFFVKTAQAKVRAVKEYLKEVLESGRKFLVFAHHRIMMEGLTKLCQETKTKFIRIDGRTQPEERMENVTKFQTKEDVRVAVLSITAANTGITLTAAQLVIFAELYWNPGVLIQAEDRAHRIGQQDSVVVQYLVARKTADDHIWPLIQNKLEVLGKVGLSDDKLNTSKLSFQKSAAEGDIRNYLKCEDTARHTSPRKNTDPNWNTY